jgi:hypothetical protein
MFSEAGEGTSAPLTSVGKVRNSFVFMRRHNACYYNTRCYTENFLEAGTSATLEWMQVLGLFVRKENKSEATSAR